MRKSTLLLIIALSVFLINAPSRTIRSLKEIKVSKIGWRVDSTLKLPDSKHEIGLVVFTEDNHIHRTTGMLKGKLRWDNFVVDAQGATIKNGKLTIQRTLPEEYPAFIPLSFYSVYEPEKVFHDTIRMNYETAIELFPLNAFRKIPGAVVKFGMDITYDNGEHQTYNDIRRIDNLEKDFHLLTRGATFKKSEFKISEDIFDIPQHKAGIVIESLRDPDIYGMLEVLLDYKGNYRMSANGLMGSGGFWGSSGSSGGTGQHGQHGQDGDPGRYGENGSNLDVFVDAYYDSILSQPLVKVYIGNPDSKKASHYLINPNGGNIYISAQGGDGGSGGDGGNGGNGGKGAIGETYQVEIKDIVISKDTAGREIRKEVIRHETRQRRGGDGGSGGDGGWGGPGGPGGNGGYIIVSYTQAAQPYLSLLSINTHGGRGGNGGDGGSAGSGGEGGTGNPNGRSGRNGRYGADGPDGYPGNNGPIEYKVVREIPW